LKTKLKQQTETQEKRNNRDMEQPENKTTVFGPCRYINTLDVNKKMKKKKKTEWLSIFRKQDPTIG